jgi:hypothetical protein
MMAEAISRTASPLPVTRFTPFEEFPSFAAVLHHCSRCPLAVTFHFTPCEAPRCFVRPGAVPKNLDRQVPRHLLARNWVALQPEQVRLKFSLSVGSPKKVGRESPKTNWIRDAVKFLSDSR